MVTSEDILALFAAAQIQTPRAGIDEEVPLVNQGLDSLDIATLLHEVEGKFDLVIPSDDLPRLRRMRDIVDYLNEQKSAPPAPSGT